MSQEGLQGDQALLHLFSAACETFADAKGETKEKRRGETMWFSGRVPHEPVVFCVLALQGCAAGSVSPAGIPWTAPATASSPRTPPSCRRTTRAARVAASAATSPTSRTSASTRRRSASPGGATPSYVHSRFIRGGLERRGKFHF